MKKTNKIFAVVLILTLLFVNTVIISNANDDDIAKTHFMVFLTEEYFGRVQEVISSIDCEYIGEVRELTNPDDYTSVYTPVLLVWVKDKNKENFYKAQEYFFDKDYYCKTMYDYLIGGSFYDRIARDHFILIVKEEYAGDIEAIMAGFDSRYIGGADYAEYFLPSSDRRVALYIFIANGDEAFFERAMQYFEGKPYADKTEYSYLFPIDEVFLCGDADRNGVFSASDARFILRCSVGLEQYDDISQCDADNNGKVTAADARMVLRYSVGLYD